MIGLDWIGLDWTGLDWIGLDWTGLDWIGLDWVRTLTARLASYLVSVLIDCQLSLFVAQRDEIGIFGGVTKCVYRF